MQPPGRRERTLMIFRNDERDIFRKNQVEQSFRDESTDTKRRGV
jgi:hypothetical protein